MSLFFIARPAADPDHRARDDLRRDEHRPDRARRPGRRPPGDRSGDLDVTAQPEARRSAVRHAPTRSRTRSSTGSSSWGSSSIRATTPRSVAAASGDLEYISLPKSFSSTVRRPALDAAIADQAAQIAAARAALAANWHHIRPGARHRPGAADDGPRGRRRGPDRRGGQQNPNGYAVGAESQVILFMFLTSMTGAVALITTRLYGISRREYSTPTSAGTIVARRDPRPVRVRALPGLFIVVASAVLFGVTGSTRSPQVRSSCSSRWSPQGAAMLLATLVSNEHQLSAIGPALGMIARPSRRRDGPDRGLPAGHADAVARDAARLGDRRLPHARCSTAGRRHRILPQLAALVAFAVGSARPWPRSGFRRQVTGGAVQRRRPAPGRPGPDEREDLVPCRRAFVGEVGRLAVEEAVRRARVGDQPVVDAGRLEAVVEGVDRLGRDDRVGPAEQAEDGRSHLARDVDRRGRIVPPGPGERAVHPDHAGQPEPERPGQERHPAAHAEAQREHRPGRGPAVLGARISSTAAVMSFRMPAQVVWTGRGAVVEVIAARLGPAVRPNQSSASASIAVLGEAEGQLLVVRMQPANVGQDHDAGPGRLGWRAPGTPRTGSGRPRSARAASSRAPRRRSARSAGGCHGRSTWASSGRWRAVGGRHRTALPGPTGRAR